LTNHYLLKPINYILNRKFPGKKLDLRGERMKKFIFITLFISVASVLLITQRTGAEVEKVYKIGDRGPAGGIVFYDSGNSSSGWRYLEASPEDQGKAVWGCYEVYLKGAKYTGLGQGKINTEAMINECREQNTAAKICADYRGGGKSDWYLPSKNELNEMFKVLSGRGDTRLVFENYWSSSQYNANSGWMQDYSTRIENHFGKDYQQRVRAIRSF